MGGRSLFGPRVLFRLVVINKIDPSLRSFIAASPPSSLVSSFMARSANFPRLPSPSEPWKGQWADVRTRLGEYRAARAEGETRTPPTRIPRVLNSYINSEGNRAGGSCFESDRKLFFKLICSPAFFFFIFDFFLRFRVEKMRIR